MHASADSDYHFALSDAAGRSVVVEYVENKMHVFATPVVTNYFLTPGSYYRVGQGHDRYQVLMEHYTAGNGILSHEEIKTRWLQPKGAESVPCGQLFTISRL